MDFETYSRRSARQYERENRMLYYDETSSGMDYSFRWNYEYEDNTLPLIESGKTYHLIHYTDVVDLGEYYALIIDVDAPTDCHIAVYRNGQFTPIENRLIGDIQITKIFQNEFTKDEAHRFMKDMS